MKQETLYKNFSLIEIFGKPARGTRLTKEKRQSGNIPLITAGENNQGVAGYISNPEMKKYNNAITIDMFGNVFYHPETFCADDNILIIELPSKINKPRALFCVSALNKMHQRKYNYSTQYRLKTYLEDSISLPYKTSIIPDFQALEDIINSLSLAKVQPKVGRVK